MKNTSRKWLSYLVIFSLLITIIPVSVNVKAAASPIVISDPMGTKDSPTPATKSKIDITGTFYGVTDLKYEVSQYRKLPNGDLVLIQTREGIEPPYKTGSNYIFYDVEIFEGINEITVKGLQDGQYVADRKYVELINLPIVTTVKFNNQDLKSNNLIVEKLFNDELVISGDVFNAEAIYAKVNGGAEEFTGSVLNNDTYIIAKIPLQRGKNTIDIVASNISKTYPLQLEIFYDDGYPYADGFIAGNELKNLGTFSTNTLTITGEFYNYVSIPTNDQLRVVFNDVDFTITKTEFDALFINGPMIGVSTSGTNYTLTNLNDDGTYQLDFDAVVENGNNYLSYTFTRGIEKFIQSFTLEHFDPNLNYVTQVSGLPATSTNKSITFYVTTNNNVNDLINFVTHKYTDSGGNSISSLLNADVTNEPTYKFTINLEPGYNTFEVNPNDGVNFGVNKKEYTVLYINSPDVKILNLVNGDRVGGAGGQSEALYAELINIAVADRDKTKLFINNRSGENEYLLDIPTHFNDPNQFIFNFDLSGGKLLSGANDITIKVTDGVTTTTTRITVFYFTSDGPTVTMSIDTDRRIFASDTFRETDLLGTFETEARYVHLSMAYGNASELIFYYNGIRAAHIGDPDGVQTITYETIPGAIIQLKFENGKLITTYPFTLKEGTNTFEIEGISNDGTSRSDKVYITRVLPPVRLIQPDVAKENVVNSNFIEVIIEADANKVIIGKNEAEYQKLSAIELNNLISALPIEVRTTLNNDYDTIIVNGVLDEVELELIDQSLITSKRFKGDVFLKSGKNKVSYTVEKNGNTKKYEFDVYYAANSSEGARYKTDLSSNGKVTVFDKQLVIDFPKNTWLVEPNSNTRVIDTYISDVKLEFGIVDRMTGKLIKVWDEALNEFVLENFVEPFKTLMPVRFLPPDRSGYAGDIYWIEAEGDITNVDSGYITTNQGEITIAYDPNIRNDAQNLLAVYHFDRDKQKWKNIGGVVETKKKTVTAAINEFGYYTVMAKRGTYNDIISHSWAANYLQTMFAKGLMLPESYNRFGSDLLASRGEFATLLIKALEIEINAGPYTNGNKLYPINPTFVDVNPLLDPPSGFYSYEYIETAGRAGIIRGLGQGEFGPDGLLTREQAAIMIARAANYKISSNAEKSKKNLTKFYDDVEKINNYSVGYVEAVTKAGIMSGSTIGEAIVFNPQSYLTRAELAAIAYRLMQNLKKLPK